MLQDGVQEADFNIPPGDADTRSRVSKVRTAGRPTGPAPPLTRILQSLHYPSTPFSSLHPLPPQFRALPTWMTSRCVVPTSIHPPLIQSPGGNQNCLLRRQNGPTSTLPTALQYLLTSPSSRSLKSLSSICLGQLYLANHQIQPSTRSEERRELNFWPVLEKSYSHHTPVGNN